ncbi:DUF6221 family protein [Crossiella sp. CA-258035]|uniref:DUF6221 family protein n=1 Tax=Crossiella sp. CA-258035 TaxID=2981138 RepID=UPI0024BC724A|nr:DUF6221 family protein [Crossiella sp. CA-258035]WHT21000.1 DUF6221 family protein [Crossiella sp. CA-258035]
MASDLVAFVRVRLDEDEQIATDASGASWAEPWRGATWHAGETNRIGVLRDDGIPVCGHSWPSQMDHIARHDPARALREVAAKRRIVDAVVATWNASCDPTDDFWVGLAPTQTATLRLLASCWSDHPDFRQEWST